VQVGLWALFAGSGRNTVLNQPICFFRILSASDLKSNRLAGLKAFIWSNLCTCHIPKKLTPRGHHDWPDKRATRKLMGVLAAYAVSPSRSIPLVLFLWGWPPSVWATIHPKTMPRFA